MVRSSFFLQINVTQCVVSLHFAMIPKLCWYITLNLDGINIFLCFLHDRDLKKFKRYLYFSKNASLLDLFFYWIWHVCRQLNNNENLLFECLDNPTQLSILGCGPLVSQNSVVGWTKMWFRQLDKDWREGCQPVITFAPKKRL